MKSNTGAAATPLATTKPAPKRHFRRESWFRRGWWLAVVLPPLAIYSATMAPGLVADGDSPKFQYLGVVLGVAHSPGYPLFVCLSWLASHVPAGSIAWRVNLLTMIAGVAAAGVAAASARAFGASRSGSILTGLGLAFGPVFWAQATAAEVYTLATALLSAVLFFVARWQTSRRDRDLLAAVAVASLALGHHPTFAMITPTLAVFVLLVDWRVLLRPRLLAVVFLCVALGLAQYAFVILRTRQGAPYVEAGANNVAELVSVLRGDQFADSLFVFGFRDWWQGRVPLVWHVVAAELGSVSVLLAFVGLLTVLRRNWRAAVLLTGVGLTTFLFAASYQVSDMPVFVISTFLALWIAAGLGLSALERALPSQWRARPALAFACAAALVVLAVTRSYAAEDLSRHTSDAQYFDAFMRQIETPAAVFATGGDSLGHAVRYEVLAEHRAPGFVRVAPPDENDDPARAMRGRRATYAFESARSLLESRGVIFGPMALADRLSDRLTRLPAHAIVAVALAPGALNSLEADDLEFLRRLGVRDLTDPMALIARDGTIHAGADHQAGLASLALGSRPTQPLTAESNAAGAVLQLPDGQTLRTRAGFVAAALAPDGRTLWADTVDRADGLSPTIDTRARPLYRAAAPAPCRDVVSGQWATFDAGSLVGFRIHAWVHPHSRVLASIPPPSLTVYAATASGMPRFVGLDADNVETLLAAQPSSTGGDTPLPQGALTPAPVGRASYALHVDRDGEAQGTLVIAPHPTAVAVRLDSPAPVPVRFCAMPVNGLVPFADPSIGRDELVRNFSESLGDGWGASEDDGANRFRAMTADRADLRFTVMQPLPLSVSLDARPSLAEVGGHVALEVNGTRLEAFPLGRDESEYDWPVPASLMKLGYNEVTIVCAHVPAPAGTHPDPTAERLAVRDVVVIRGRS